MLDVKSLEKAFIPKPIDTVIHEMHPISKIIGLMIVIVASIITMNITIEIIILVFLIIEIIFGKVCDRILHLLKAFRIPFLLMTILFFIFYMPLKAIVYALRLLISAISVGIFFSTTRTLDLAQALDEIGVSPKLKDIFELSIRLIPLVSKDAVENIEALTLRGRIRGGFFGLVDSLAMIIANSMERARYIREALVLKFYRTKGRTYPYELKLGKIDFVHLASSMIILILALCVHIIWLF